MIEPSIGVMARPLALCCALMVLLALCAPAQAATRADPVERELRRLDRAGALADGEYEQRRKAYREVRAVARRLPGRRKVELMGVLGDLRRIAGQGSLTSSRVAPLWLTLQRNREWWTTRPLLAPGTRVSFPGSELVWQAVPGHGIQFHPLANFAKLNGLWSGRRYDARMERLAVELAAMAVDRAGGVAWEYSYPFGRVRAPWVSALAQGTALQSLARVSHRLGRDDLLALARRGLGIFEARPPVGVRVGGPRGGSHYLLYSGDRDLRVLNGFVQALVGLHDYAQIAGDERARVLFARGERAARVEVAGYDTGAWSLYSRGRSARESDLGYHRLLRDFLRSLCVRVPSGPYCDTAGAFTAYLRRPPTLELITQRARQRKTVRVRFALSKVSDLTVRIARGDRVMREARFRGGRGERFVQWRPRRSGRHAIEVVAVDLAGNRTVVRGTITVAKAKKPKREPRRRGGRK